MSLIDTHSEEWKTQCFVNYVIEKLKPLPKYQRENAFNSLTAKRRDKDAIKKAVFEGWNT